MPAPLVVSRRSTARQSLANHRAGFTASSRAAERTYTILFAAVVLTLVSMVLYVSVRLTTVLSDEYTRSEAVMAALLLGAEFFLMFHAIGYFSSAVKASKRDATAQPDVFVHPVDVPVAVLVAAFGRSPHDQRRVAREQWDPRTG